MSEVDVSGYVRMCDDLAKIAGKDFAAVILPQMAQLLAACIRRTPARKAGDIAKRVSRQGSFIEFADGTTISTFKKADDAEMFLDTSTYAEFADRWPKGTPKPSLHGGLSWHQMNSPNRRWSNARWAKFQALEAQRIRVMKERYEAVLAARGLAKKTWVQIADELGIDVKAAGYVRNARYRGREFKEGFASKIIDQGAFIIEIVNSNPLVCGKLDGHAIIAGAIRDRQKAFDIDMKLGVFDDVKRRALRYPGVFTN